MVLKETNFSGLKLVKQGKVRDIYDLGEAYLMVASDRLSAFDVIMEEGIPNKGKVLNRISEFWFNFFEDVVDNHMITADVEEYPEECEPYAEQLKDRSMLVLKSEVIPLECIVRGYISGSGWNEYKKQGTVCGIKLPEGLVESDKLPEPLFTPSTKAEIGGHDENISEEKAIELVGKETYDKVKEYALTIYNKAYEFAYERDIIIADTKMEFGVFEDEIILIDEVLTPDSSRFWPKDKYEPGKSQFSYDKQYVRDYLLSIGFDKNPPAPNLPEDVINNTSEKYLEVLLELTGIEIEE